MLQALNNVGKVQHNHKVQPVILDYDANEGVLREVDGGFALFLGSQKQEDLLALIALDTGRSG